jgi:hypothetical protein
MTDIHAVLLIPTEGDPHGLLREGPCGARPPIARHFPRWEALHEESWADPTCPVALCGACRQPWPCETPGDVEIRRLAHWKPWPHSLTHDCALVLTWGGVILWQGTTVLAHKGGVDLGLLHRFLVAAQHGMTVDGPWPGTLVLLDSHGREEAP